MASYKMTPSKPHDSTKFYNHLLANIVAETYYKMGNDLYCSILEQSKKSNCKPEDKFKLWPACVNLAFSCEIILKLLYENDHGKTTTGHKLYTDLYKNLSDKSQELLSNLTIQKMITDGYSNYTFKDFEDDLKKSENTFAHERYAFEIDVKIADRKHSVDGVFLSAFSTVLNRLSKDLV